MVGITTGRELLQSSEDECDGCHAVHPINMTSTAFRSQTKPKLPIFTY